MSGLNQTLSKWFGVHVVRDSKMKRLSKASHLLKQYRVDDCGNRHEQTNVHTRNGFRMLLDPSSTVDQSLLYSGFWEAEQIKFLFGHERILQTKLQKVFFDVGAYSGLYSLIAARAQVFEQIIALEPDRTNICQLYANIFLNNYERLIEVHRLAASNHEGEVVFSDSKLIPGGNRGGTGVVQDSSADTYKVGCGRLDTLAPFRNKFVVAKIDVEGHELETLEGMKNLLLSNDVLFQVESFPNMQEAFFAEAFKLNLKHLGTIGPDHYFTN